MNSDSKFGLRKRFERRKLTSSHSAASTFLFLTLASSSFEYPRKSPSSSALPDALSVSGWSRCIASADVVGIWRFVHTSSRARYGRIVADWFEFMFPADVVGIRIFVLVSSARPRYGRSSSRCARICPLPAHTTKVTKPCPRCTMSPQPKSSPSCSAGNTTGITTQALCLAHHRNHSSDRESHHRK